MLNTAGAALTHIASPAFAPHKELKISTIALIDLCSLTNGKTESLLA